MAQLLKNLPTMLETFCHSGDRDSILGLGRSFGEGNGNLSSILAWRIPRTEEPGGLQSMPSHRAGYNWATNTHTHTHTHTERYRGLLWWCSGKEPTCPCRRCKRHELVPCLGRSRGVGNGNLLHYSRLGNTRDRGDWWAPKSRTQLLDWAGTYIQKQFQSFFTGFIYTTVTKSFISVFHPVYFHLSVCYCLLCSFKKKLIGEKITMLCWFLPITKWISHNFIYLSHSFWASLFSPNPTTQVITESQAGVPVLHSNLPLTVYFTQDIVNTSVLLSQFIPP